MLVLSGTQAKCFHSDGWDWGGEIFCLVIKVPEGVVITNLICWVLWSKIKRGLVPFLTTIRALVGRLIFTQNMMVHFWVVGVVRSLRLSIRSIFWKDWGLVGDVES